MPKITRQHPFTGIPVFFSTVSTMLAAKGATLALLAPPPSVKSHAS